MRTGTNVVVFRFLGKIRNGSSSFAAAFKTELNAFSETLYAKAGMRLY